MYRINLETNRIEALTEKSFSELKLTERHHLQEWLAHTPNALGEELLIIQKEFDGFDDTRERLDLLALDKDGRLVVIENKLDDSGRNVVWQALKYASYCSGLTKEKIIDIYQQYLDKYRGQMAVVDARQGLLDFFDETDYEEIRLNPGNEQRIIMVAANFRKEVTSTALWLLGYRIKLQCFKVTPYQRTGELFLNVDQIIPPPEAADYMIGIADKVANEQTSVDEMKSRHVLRQAYWDVALDVVKKSPCRLFDNVSPSNRGTAGTGTGMAQIWYELVFRFNEARVCIHCDRRNEDENKFVFDKLYEQKDAIEMRFGASLEWNRNSEAKASKVQFCKEFDGRDRSNWEAIANWMSEHIYKLELAASEHLKNIRSQLKELK